MDAPKAGTKLLVVCNKCEKRLSLDEKLAGKAIKCPCGNILKVPIAATSGSVAATQPTARVVSPQPVAKSKAAPPTAPQPSFLDQLTEADFSRPAFNPYAPPKSDAISETAVLRKYAGTDAIEEEVNRSAKNNLMFLAVVNFIGAAIYIGLGVLLLALSSVLGALADVLPLAALGAIFAGILFGFGLFDLLTGIGLVKRTFWGWWLCVLGLSWAAVDRASGIAIRFMFTQDWTMEISKAIGAAIFLLSSFFFMSFMCQKKTMKMFKVNVHPGVAWAIGIVFGLAVGGVGFGFALSAIRSAQAAP